MNNINRRNWFYDCGIFFETYVMDDFGNLVSVPILSNVSRNT